MAVPLTMKHRRLVAKTVLLGVLVAGLYALMFVEERDLLRITAHGGWTFVVPLGIAFLFSLVHGAFTHHFWDMLGIKPRHSRGGK